MSDGVDDLQYAEDVLGQMATEAQAILRFHGDMLAAHHPVFEGVAEHVRSIMLAFDNYCRPTCGWRDSGACESGGEEDGCGCPCNHGS